MTRDELAGLMYEKATNSLPWGRAVREAELRPGGSWTAIVGRFRTCAATALAALRPKLVWTEWQKGIGIRYQYLMVGTLRAAVITSRSNDPRLRVGLSGNTLTVYQTHDFDEAAFRAEIERRVLEAMGWPS